MNNTHCLTTILPSGKSLKSVTRKTDKGSSNYANAMFRKYGEDVIVKEVVWDKDYNDVYKCTWSS